MNHWQLQLVETVFSAAFLAGAYTLRKRTVPFGSRMRVLPIVNGLCIFVFGFSYLQDFNPLTLISAGVPNGHSTPFGARPD